MIKLTFVAALLAVLAACGGGDDEPVDSCQVRTESAEHKKPPPKPEPPASEPGC